MASTAMKANASKSAPVCRCVGKGGGGEGGEGDEVVWQAGEGGGQDGLMCGR